MKKELARAHPPRPRAALDTAAAAASSTSPSLDLQREVDRVLLSRYAPAGVVVDQNLEVLQFRGRTSAFLEHAPGKPSMNLFKMAREGLGVEIRSLVERARRESAPVRSSPVTVSRDGQAREVALEALPIRDERSQATLYFVLFQDVTVSAGAAGAAARRSGAAAASKQVAAIRSDLAATRERLQTTIEDYEASEEALKLANEELLSANEDLEATSEEVESARTELRAANERLAALDQELASGHAELARVQGDVSSLLDAVNVPMVMISNDLRLRRFTPAAQRVFSIGPADVDRPLAETTPVVDKGELVACVREALDHAVPLERELKDQDGRWHALRVTPCRSREGRLEGAILVLTDIHAVKSSLELVLAASAHYEGIAETVREPIIVLDPDLRVRTANRAFYQTFDTTREETVARHIFGLANGQWNIPRLRELLEQVLPRDRWAHDYEVVFDLPRIGSRTMSASLVAIERQTERLKNQVDNLLDLARTRGGRIVLEREKVDVLALVRGVAGSLAPELERSEAPLAIDARGKVTGFLDRRRIEQVVTNLLTNAIRYGEGKPIRISVRGDLARVRIAVQDRGVGIAKEDMPRLFEPFANVGTARRHVGLGLGLHIVRQIVEAHGGRVLVRSELGLGSTFAVELPRRPKEA